MNLEKRTRTAPRLRSPAKGILFLKIDIQYRLNPHTLVKTTSTRNSGREKKGVRTKETTTSPSPNLDVKASLKPIFFNLSQRRVIQKVIVRYPEF